MNNELRKIDDRMQHTCTKLASRSWALLNIRNYVDISTLKIVYFSLIYSHL